MKRLIKVHQEMTSTIGERLRDREGREGREGGEEERVKGERGRGGE